jgi:hypothetical protein
VGDDPLVHGSWIIVMMQGPGVVVRLIWTFALDIFHQSSQNVTTEFTIHHLFWWNKFLMHDAFSVKKKTNQH